ncbi:hypothetical protein CM19_00265 [Candidatus Acidianus copahuensis]|uniref:SCP domain-containing protein n=1 Tax=Candidatus Acidianus copahuensis TaxID=1160895 RepID=A0A031LY35_9CREN|nr:CAP domain-containing protein [Candidatus Acidianus copahuensis]EZQ12058.1 hypothetical protein CM19_00265 [Candidatus Acidianus copahuensis]
MSLIKNLIEYLNRIRLENGIPHVSYENSGVSSFRVNYMLREQIFSHYDKNGIHPCYYFTKVGNYYGSEEAIGYAEYSQPWLREGVTVINTSKKIMYNMVYNDEESDWGHRDTLLNPCFNYVDISVAWNSRHIYLNITMIAKWIHWDVYPSIDKGKFYMRGKLLEMRPKSILIFRDIPNPCYTSRKYYDLGKLIAGILPKGFMYKDIYTITAKKYRVDEELEIEFSLPTQENGILTVVLIAEDPRGIKWEPKSGKSINQCPILTYAFKSDGH